jgi:hypothetical protein
MFEDGKKFHPPEEIDHYIRHNYTGLGDARAMSIGVPGNYYQVMVADVFHVMHKLRIDPRDIDHHLNNLTDKQRTMLAPTELADFRAGIGGYVPPTGTRQSQEARQRTRAVRKQLCPTSPPTTEN